MLGSGISIEATGRDAVVAVGSSTGSKSVELGMIICVEVAGNALDRGSGS